MAVFLKWLELIFPPRESEQRVRDATEEAVLALLAPLVLPSRVVSLLPYQHPLVASLIQEAKYHQSEKAWKLLGSVLAAYLREFVIEEDMFNEHPFALIPMPLSEKRKVVRGYNQTEEVVRGALRILELPEAPHTRVLKRIRDTASQTHLSRKARLQNMTHAFEASEVDPRTTYLLIDDVVTTGATFEDAARALTEGGASRVVCVALAH